jgi:hypothetical protein
MGIRRPRTPSPAAHAARLKANNQVPDFKLLSKRNAVATSKWRLAYRADARNWRNWVRDQETAGRS